MSVDYLKREDITDPFYTQTIVFNYYGPNGTQRVSDIANPYQTRISANRGQSGKHPGSKAKMSIIRI